jgi:hypothetical protein
MFSLISFVSATGLSVNSRRAEQQREGLGARFRLVDDRKLQRMFGDSLEKKVELGDGYQKAPASDVILGLSGYVWITHQPVRERSFRSSASRTAGHGSPSFGDARYEESLSRSTSRCQSGTGTDSGFAATWFHRVCTYSIRSSTDNSSKP